MPEEHAQHDSYDVAEAWIGPYQGAEQIADRVLASTEGDRLIDHDGKDDADEDGDDQREDGARANVKHGDW